MEKISMKLPGTEKILEVQLEFNGEALRMSSAGRTREVRILSRQASEGVLEIDGRVVPYYLSRKNGTVQVWLGGRVYTLEKTGAGSRRGKGAGAGGLSSGEIKAPMPGKILQIKAAPGDTAETGQTLVVMESMKMEMTLTAPAAGVIKEVMAVEGAMVEMGALLVKMETSVHGDA